MRATVETANWKKKHLLLLNIKMSISGKKVEKTFLQVRLPFK